MSQKNVKLISDFVRKPTVIKPRPEVAEVTKPKDIAPIKKQAQKTLVLKKPLPARRPIALQKPIVKKPVPEVKSKPITPKIAPQTPPKTLSQSPPKRPQTTKRGRAKRKFTPTLPSKATALTTLTVLAFLATTYIAVDVWRTNQALKDQLVSPTSAPSATPQSQEGTDETPISSGALANYSVAATQPRALYITKLNVAARILPMAVNTDGSMQAPINIFDAGWYSPGVKPGETGAAIINAHSFGRTQKGIFAHLDQLEIGDEIVVERGDYKKLTYTVTHTETVPLKNVDMQEFMTPRGTATEALNLMTCGGAWMKEDQTYDHRIIVYTERILEL